MLPSCNQEDDIGWIIEAAAFASAPCLDGRFHPRIHRSQVFVLFSDDNLNRNQIGCQGGQVPDRKTILVVGRNLFFLPRIQNVARPSGYDVKLTATASEFWDAYGEGSIALVFVDLEGESEIWTAVVRGLRERVPKIFRIVAFGPHSDTESLDLARELGCDAVLTKGKFSSGLRKIVETEGAELKARG